MKIVFIVVISLVCLQVVAEEKTCAVKGMECDGCVDMVKEKVCGDQFSTCDVEVKDRVKKRGELHLITKNPMAKIEPDALNKLIASTTYVVERCTKTTH